MGGGGCCAVSLVRSPSQPSSRLIIEERGKHALPMHTISWVTSIVGTNRRTGKGGLHSSIRHHSTVKISGTSDGSNRHLIYFILHRMTNPTS